MAVNFEQFETEAEAVAYLKAEMADTIKTTAQAKSYIRSHLPKEGFYQDKIIKHIRQLLPEAFVWKAAAGPYSRQGIPDICAVINGRFYGFEVKRPFVGVLSRIQEQTIRQIREAGGRAYVVTYPAQVTEILKPEITGGTEAQNEQAAAKAPESQGSAEFCPEVHRR